MPTTTHGYPYPNGNDLVMDGNDVIQALAEAMEDALPGRIRFGRFTGTTDAGGMVTIPHGLGEQPLVVLAADQVSSHHATARDPDLTNFAVYVRNLTAANAPLLPSTGVSIYWLAIV